MPQNMLEWAAREPALTLAFAYILYHWLYSAIRARDARRRYRHSLIQQRAGRALPMGATQSTVYVPALLTRIAHATYAPINVCIVAALVYYAGRSIIAAM